MIDISYQKKFLKVNQIWYPNDIAISALLKQKRKADILFVHGVPVEETKGAFRGWQEYHTCMNDISISEEEMLAAINKAVRYQFRRSEKDNIEICFYTKADIGKSPSLIDSFADIYERMYQSKGSDTKLNRTAIKKYLQADAILFSAVWHEGEMIVFHSYIWDDTDARLLHSASCFREESADQSMIGRANKRLHWEDILYFKKKGLLRYDWGGISDFENPNGIDEFKLKFGGDKITYYNVFAGNTLLGKLAVSVMKSMKRVN
ncbi:MAG: aminoacyltransferase [Lachnospiraceae bacterium]|nr:aminoacyltransferase [Lachnospiraceae bacterium]